MTPARERRLFQAVAGLACLVPLIAGFQGVAEGVRFVAPGVPPSASLDSHFRYLSGIFLGVGIAFAYAVAGIRARGRLFGMLAGFVVLGGLGRLLSAAERGLPSGANLFGLGMELGVVPLLFLWQRQLARRAAAGR